MTEIIMPLLEEVRAYRLVIKDLRNFYYDSDATNGSKNVRLEDRPSNERTALRM